MSRSNGLLPSNSDWKQFLQENEQACHDSVIDATSATIETVIHSRLLPLYAMRAKAYAKKGQFYRALFDAEEIILLKPLSAKGFLCKAEIHMMQKDAVSAVRVLKFGLSKVPRCDPDISKLKSRLKAANEQLARCVDFIAKLPIEVMGEILRYIGTGQLLELVHVSKTWRTRILGFPNAWAFVDTEWMMNRKRINQLCHFMPAISKYLVHARLSILDDKLLQAFTTQVQNGHIGKLNILILDDGNFEDECYVAPDKLLDTIPRTENQLVEIILAATFNYTNTLPFLSEVLRRCPKLKVMNFNRPSVLYLPVPNTMELPTSHGLASLTLRCSDVDVDIIELLLRRCNLLRSLRIYAEVVADSAGKDIFEIVQNYGKNLEALDLDSGEDCYELPAEPKSPGLRFLQLGPDYTSLSSLVPLLCNHHTTLEELFLPVCEYANPDINKRALAMLRGRSFPLLSRLDISVLPETEDTTVEMIRRCSKLENLMITTLDPGIAHRVLVSIAASPTHHLQHIVFFGIQTSNYSDVDGGLKGMFEAFASLGTRSALCRVFLQGFKVPRSSDILMLWAGLPKISSLTLSSLCISKPQMDELQRKCKESHIRLNPTMVVYND